MFSAFNSIDSLISEKLKLA